MTPRRSRGRRLVLVAVAAVALVLAGCSEVKNNGQNSLEPKGPQAQKIYDLFVPILIIAIVVGIAIIVATVFARGEVPVPHGQEREPEAGPRQHPARDRLDDRSRRCCSRSSRCRPSPPSSTSPRTPGPSALQVTVEGKQWWWQFTYPDAKVVTADELVIPTGRDVFVNLDRLRRHRRLEDLQRDPQLLGARARGQEGRRPRPDQHAHARRPTNPGTYLGQCAEYCGLSHANMRFRVIAKTPADFEQWLERAAAGSGEPALPTSDGDDARPGPTQELHRQRRSSAPTATSSTTRRRRPTGRTSRTSPAAPPSPAARYPLNRDEPRQLGAGRAVDDPDVVAGLPASHRVEGICVGMPSFIENTPPGMQSMTQQQAEDIADFLLEQK